jgi:hypothetical protein
VSGAKGEASGNSSVASRSPYMPNSRAASDNACAILGNQQPMRVLNKRVKPTQEQNDRFFDLGRARSGPNREALYPDDPLGPR